VSQEPSVEPSVKEINKERQGRDGSGSSDCNSTVVEEIWDFYVSCLKPPTTELGPSQRKVIEEALKVASAKDCCQAIRGLSRDDWRQKRNESADRPGERLWQIHHALQGKKGETNRERIVRMKQNDLDKDKRTADDDYWFGTEFGGPYEEDDWFEGS
jgi:hypothetical protein